MDPFGTKLFMIKSREQAAVAEPVDAKDLKSFEANTSWEFESPPRHYPSLKLRMASGTISKRADVAESGRRATLRW